MFPVNVSLSTQSEMAISEMDRILSTDTPSYDPNTFEDQVCPQYSFTELQIELGQLKDGKASGYDGIPNELLKNTGFNFRLYLQAFLNKIMETGSIPSALNIGKCMLVHKVGLHTKVAVSEAVPLSIRD